MKKRAVPSKRRAPRRRRKARTRPWLAPLVAALAAVPALFLVGMVAGEVAKSVRMTQVVDNAPAAAARSDEMQLDLAQDARVAIIDPRGIRMDLARGWEVERQAFNDTTALLFFSGPFFEEHRGQDYYAHAIGDLFINDHLEVASEISRAFADRRYFMALTRFGTVEFGYSGWRPGYEDQYAAFVGGLGYLYNDAGPAPDYSDPYTGLKQELHNMIPRERLLVGRNAEGKLIVMKTLPMPLTTTSWVARSHGMVEAYYLDQGNKARFIVPGRVDDSPRYNLPYMLRISDKTSPPMMWTPAPLEDYKLHHKKRRKRKRVATPPPEGLLRADEPMLSEPATPEPIDPVLSEPEPADRIPLGPGQDEDPMPVDPN